MRENKCSYKHLHKINNTFKNVFYMTSGFTISKPPTLQVMPYLQYHKVPYGPLTLRPLVLNVCVEINEMDITCGETE